MGGLRRGDSPNPKSRVDFAESLVTGVSRPLTNAEHWTLYYFERHASDCKSCYKPYRVHRAGGQLCDVGHGLAQEVAELRFKLRDNGEVYVHPHADHPQEIRLEMPSNYSHTMGLLKAIQRASTSRPAYDRTYHVSPRTARPSSSKTDGLAPGFPPSPGSLVEPDLIFSRRDKGSQKRGSLYDEDMRYLEEAERRERTRHSRPPAPRTSLPTSHVDPETMRQSPSVLAGKGRLSPSISTDATGNTLENTPKFAEKQSLSFQGIDEAQGSPEMTPSSPKDGIAGSNASLHPDPETAQLANGMPSISTIVSRQMLSEWNDIVDRTAAIISPDPKKQSGPGDTFSKSTSKATMPPEPAQSFHGIPPPTSAPPDCDEVVDSALTELLVTIRDQSDWKSRYIVPRTYDPSDSDSEKSYDRNSVFSYQPSMTSASSFASQSLHDFHMKSLADLLWDDLELHKLSCVAIGDESIGKERLQRNLVRLLRQFAADLKLEAEDKDQFTAIKIVRLQSRSVSREICSRAALGEESSQRSKGKSRAADVPEIEPDSEEENFENLSDDEEYDVSEAKRFLESSFALLSLRKNLKSFVYPTFDSKLTELVKCMAAAPTSATDLSHIRHVVSELRHVSPQNITIRDECHPGWQDQLKASVEDWTGERWDWWPLSPPKRSCTKDSARIAWTCPCGDQRWENVPKTFAQDLGRAIRKYAKSTQAEASSATSAPTSQSTTSASKTVVQNLPGSSSTKQPSLPIKAAASQGPGGSSVTPAGPPPLRILLIVKTGTVHYLSQIWLGDMSTASFFERLRSDYFKLRGIIRRVFSVWRFSHCDFYRIEKFDEHCYAPKKRDEFPHIKNPDYRYNPKPMDDIPPITAHEFYRRFYQPRWNPGAVFHWRHRCKSGNRGHSGEVLSLLPKKTSALDGSSDARETFWGICAQEVISLRWVLVYNIVCLVPLAVFFFAWVFKLGQPFDMQNGSVPMSLMASMLSLFWSIFLSSLRFGGDRLRS